MTLINISEKEKKIIDKRVPIFFNTDLYKYIKLEYISKGFSNITDQSYSMFTHIFDKEKVRTYVSKLLDVKTENIIFQSEYFMETNRIETINYIVIMFSDTEYQEWLIKKRDKIIDDLL